MDTKKQQSDSAPGRGDPREVSLWFCLGLCCAPKEWFIQREGPEEFLWTITDGSGSLHAVAAEVPTCPHCGDRLHPAAREEKPNLF